MMADSDMIWTQVQARLSEYFGDEKLAKLALLDALEFDRIRAVAHLYVKYGRHGRQTSERNKILDGLFWRDPKIGTTWDGSDAAAIFNPIYKAGSVEPRYLAKAMGLKFLKGDVERLWPSVPAEPQVVDVGIHGSKPPRNLAQVEQGSPVAPARKPGRPAKWDWERASAWLTSYLVDNGYPATQEELIDKWRDWFEQNYQGDPPGDTTLGDKISKYYQAHMVPGK